jgi:2-polyprenyl-3-methyl-5-hydroxy-6-metoxy-1,4-benzoquinol methylase/uncharacterized protein (DUF2062 family)
MLSINRIKALMHQILTEHHSRYELAMGTAVGVFIGLSPFYGFHLPLCLLAAFALRLNKVLVYAAANISNPFFAPFLILASYEIGHYLATGKVSGLNIADIRNNVKLSFMYWLLGSLILGAALALLSFTLVYIVAGRKQSTKTMTSFDFAVEKLHTAFLPCGHFAAGFAKGKAKGDPVYQRVLRMLSPHSSILDVGGGQGILCLLHALLHGGRQSRVVVDYDAKRIAHGKIAAEKVGVHVRFLQQDVRELTAQGKFDAVCVLDVLHYMPPTQQKQVLDHLKLLVADGGVLIIRDMDRQYRWRTFFTLMQERFSLLFKFTQATKLYPPSSKEISKILRASGFSVDVTPCWGLTPFANVLIVARPQK